jgi:hypothetical protein
VTTAAKSKRPRPTVDFSLPLSQTFAQPHEERGWGGKVGGERERERFIMRFPFSGRVRLAALVVVVLGLAAGGIAYASIPDSDGVIHGCYTKRDGSLRVIDTNVGGSCSTSKENALNWNQTGPQGPSGPTGQTGPAGTAGPTSLADGAQGGVGEARIVLITHTVTADEAGLTILTNPFEVFDNDGTTGGTTIVSCQVRINATLLISHPVRVSDSGAQFGDTSSATNLLRTTLGTGDVVTVECAASVGDGGEANVTAQLLLEHVGS